MFDELVVEQGITGIWVYQNNGVSGFNWVYFPDALMIERLGLSVESGYRSVPENENLRTWMYEAGLSTSKLSW